MVCHLAFCASIFQNVVFQFLIVQLLFHEYHSRNSNRSPTLAESLGVSRGRGSKSPTRLPKMFRWRIYEVIIYDGEKHGENYDCRYSISISMYNLGNGW